MTSAQQRAELQRQIWQIANDVRGSVDGWDFKQYVLGTLFYRFISENFTNYITGGDDSVNYATMDDGDENIVATREDAIKTKGYFIYPSELFVNVAANASKNHNLNTELADIFKSIECSANGYPSEADIKGLFADFDTTSNRLGNTVKDNNVLTDQHIQQIMAIFHSKDDVEHVAKSVSLETITDNDYNLSVSSYVEARDTREKVDITQLNAELKTTVGRIDQLRSEIDAIVAEIEG
ncbi:MULTISPECIES: type I restriction-modification system subunit M N-terminal domain-containing protein [unclassified Endozoicomonas]|uniref:type I restriction-modification system subunit M N-terminal domain-containing protein n=1 Tax=unclassified Endozoicomonas TaxID=2644528 RepID=UPI0021497F8A|nr:MULTISPECIES: type I restriction-modification system subunit M N-terminal domain-containing protein [unclassified Endozoicomonas]